MKRHKRSIWAFLALAFLSGTAHASMFEYRFPDGTGIKVHFSEKTLEASGTDEGFASSVLDAAVSAYQTITQFEGFDTPGYSFALPDRNYAFDPDQTIDIYLGSGQLDNEFPELGGKNKLFRDAPCFDTRKVGAAQYEAMILLPANYPEFIRNWEKINPSSLGQRNVHVDLRGTLIHEMTHVVMFYYNKNLNKAGEAEAAVLPEADAVANKHLDWYVEGLARYFETFAGARHDFYSQGFKQTLPDKIRFSRGGSNYFMRYPDQAFTGLRYENAIFWRFIDTRFGMAAIEAISRRLRDDPAGFKQALEEISGRDFNELLTEYAAAVLLGDFELKEDSVYLNEIAATRLWLEGGMLYLLDGYDDHYLLGASCHTDWIGRWEEAKGRFGEPPVAGDSTDQADVSGWATDYVEIRFAKNEISTHLSLRHEGQGKPLYLQLFVFTKGGSQLNTKFTPVAAGTEASIGLDALLKENSLVLQDVQRAVLLVTNSDPSLPAPYEINLPE